MSLLAKEPVKVLLITGGHDHSVSFYSVFEDSRFMVVVDPHPSAFVQDIRDRADVVVLYDMAPEVEQRKRDNLRAFVEAGKGIVVLHHAIGDNNTWAWWYEEVVGGRYLFKAEGGKAASSFKHDQRVLVQVAKRHPITDGLADFSIEDETYKGLWISPKAEVLLTTNNPTSDGPVAWLGPHAKARVVYVQLGHGSPAHSNANYRRLIGNAILWAAGREAN